MKLSIFMTRRETVLGWSYLLISMFVLPYALAFVNFLLAQPLSATVLNLIFFALNTLCVAVIFHRFLGASVRAALDRPWRCLRFAALGFMLYYLASSLLSYLIAWIDPTFFNVNDAAISELSREYTALMAFATIWLAPITEETLYRGLLFQSLHRKSRVLAYGVSVLVFAGIHVMGYVGLYDWLTLLMCFVQYLPAGAALAWTYERADTVIAPMLMHIAINQIGVAAMR